MASEHRSKDRSIDGRENGDRWGSDYRSSEDKLAHDWRLGSTSTYCVSLGSKSFPSALGGMSK